MMTRLIRKLQKKELRDIYVESAINDVIPTQIFNLRKSQGWSQRALAKAANMAQPRIAVLEGADYENYSISTLKRLASAFDVALIVKFAPFSELIKFKENLSSHDLQIPDFNRELDSLVAKVVGEKPEEDQRSNLPDSPMEIKFRQNWGKAVVGESSFRSDPQINPEPIEFSHQADAL